MLFDSVELLTGVTYGAVVTHTDKWQLLAGWLLLKAIRLRVPRHKKNTFILCADFFSAIVTKKTKEGFSSAIFLRFHQSFKFSTHNVMKVSCKKKHMYFPQRGNMHVH